MRYFILPILMLFLLAGCSAPSIPEKQVQQAGWDKGDETTKTAICGNDICEDGETAYTCIDCGIYGEKPILSRSECISQNGEVVNLDNKRGCLKSFDFLGTVNGCPCVCCEE